MREVAAVLVTLLALVGCTGSDVAQTREPTVSPSSSPQQLIDLVSLRPQDVPREAQIELLPGGDQVEGQVTLDECDFDFATEGMRVARRQVAVRYPGEAASYGNEVVVYDSADHAARALDEWRKAVRECPEDEFRPSSVEGVPDVRTELLEFHTLDSLPVGNNTVARQVVTTRDGRSLQIALVYQQQGPVLDAHYLSTSGTPTRRQVARVTAHAGRTGARLATLPGGPRA